MQNNFDKFFFNFDIDCVGYLQSLFLFFFLLLNDEISRQSIFPPIYVYINYRQLLSL